MALTWEDVDLENGLVTVRKTIQQLKGQGLVIGEPKTDKSRRMVAQPEFALQALTAHKALATTKCPYMFCTANATPFSPRNIVRHFKRVLAKAGLPSNVRIHDLRHTFVSFLLSQNMPPKDVQVIAGHADYSTTMNIYGHLMPGAQKKPPAK